MPPITEAGKVDIIERISRVLAGQYFSRNAAGAAGNDNASVLVEQNWVDFQDDAIAVLKTLRSPPHTSNDEAEIAIWTRIIDDALDSHRHYSQRAE
ncbi:MAG: hypothetical protein IBJ12_00860 [Sphingomonadaceae bacterium]|nr:hypothetical protein [Sphingomonadaceae bacterium]